MPKAERINLEITAEVAARKFFLREMLFFFIEQRKKAIADSEFSFTLQDFSEYIKKMEFYKSMGDEINDKNIIEHLKILRKVFCKRNKNLSLKNPRTPLLVLKIKKIKGKPLFVIEDCLTEDLENAIRFLDISLMLHHNINSRVENEDLNIKIGSINSESLFGQDSKKRIIFVEKISEKPLGLKERAIFNTLKNNFNKEVNYSDIYISIAKLTKQTKPREKRKGYVNDGIVELKKKLYKISGNPQTIITIVGRESIYKLIY